MDANFVILAPEETQIMPFGAAEEQMLTAANEYSTVLEKANELVSQAPDAILSGSPSTIYLKKLGHRPLKTEDAEAVINTLGTDADKQVIIDFKQAQESLNERLQNTKNIGLVLKQSNVPYDQMYKRGKRPDLWKPEQIIQIIEVIRRLQL